MATAPVQARLTRSENEWCLDPGGPASSLAVWKQAPAVLNHVLGGLFEAQPEDVLCWLHHRVWDLHTDRVRRADRDENFAEVSQERTPIAQKHPWLNVEDSVPADHLPFECQPWRGQGFLSARAVDVKDAVPRSSLLGLRGAGTGHFFESAAFQRERVQFDAALPVVQEVEYNSEMDLEHKASNEVSQSGSQWSRPSQQSRPSHQWLPMTTGESDDQSTKTSIRQPSETSAPSFVANKERFNQELTNDISRNGFERYFGKNHHKRTSIERSPTERLEHEATVQSFDTASQRVDDRCCTLNPVGQVRLSWDILFFICLAYEMWATPFELVYLPDYVSTGHDRNEATWLRVAAIIVLAIFCFDIFMNFITGYVEDGTIVMQKKKIARKYVLGWFWLDLAATVPELLIFSFNDAFFLLRFGRGMKAYKLLKALRLLRTMRLIRTQGFANMIMRHQEMKTSYIFAIHIAQLHFAIIVLTHFHAAVWAALQPDDWFPTSSHEAFVRYLESLWIVAPALTLGGDLPATGDAQRILRLFVSIERVTYIVLVAKWLLWRALLLQGEAQHSDLREGALAYLKHHRASPALQLKVFQNLRETRKVLRRQQYFKSLTTQSFPLQLKHVICDELWGEKLMSLDLIHHVASWQAEFIKDLALKCGEEVIPSKVVLFSAGELSTTAYYVIRGVMAVTYHETEVNVPDYTSGMWIGEKALINPELRRIQTIVCKVISELMTIKASDFQELLESFGLKQQYEQLLQKQLWLGLCGRCGILGDHFGHDCPLMQCAEDGGRMLGMRVPFLPGQQGVRRPSMMRREHRKVQQDEKRKSTADLSRFLSEHSLHRLQNVMTNRYGISTLNDLKLSTIEAIRADPEVQLTQTEWQAMTDVSIKEYRRKIRRATTQILSKAGDKHSHFIFISHYKVEAGTEAALMQEDLIRILREDPSNLDSLQSPVFLDSEDLRDLNDLKQHVRRSHNLVLLLTPGVLTRPWCLVEIVCAIASGVRVVPVEVQRRDLKFTFPDEAYLKRIGAGEELDSSCQKLIIKEGIQLAELERSLREVFCRIALPFSPHKTANIRQAELRDILKQCEFSNLRESNRISTTSGGDLDWCATSTVGSQSFPE